MRVPKITDNKNTKEIKKEVINMNNISEPFRVLDISDDKLKSKWIKRIEVTIRKSLEYNEYISYLKRNFNITHCSFFPKIDINEIKKCGIEFHHYPLTLYDIVFIVVENMIARGYENDLDLYLIANEVMELHYKNNVGLIPLSGTVHEMAHSGNLFIPLNLVFGDYKRIIQDYRYGVSSDIIEKLDELTKLGDTVGLDYLPTNLNKKLLVVDTAEIFPPVDNLISNETIEILETTTTQKLVEHRKNKVVSNKVDKHKNLADSLFSDDI